jgi:hypothetical protein
MMMATHGPMQLLCAKRVNNIPETPGASFEAMSGKGIFGGLGQWETAGERVSTRMFHTANEEDS